MTTNITLSAYDIVTLLMEMPIKREDLHISSNSSFLSIIATLEHEMNKRSSNAKSGIW